MKKFLSFLLIIICACIFAGIYGVIHDQLTYSISPEYYTKFKFYQFGLIDEGVEAVMPNPRMMVSIVGFLATWWMGIPIGMMFGALSIIQSDWKTMLKNSLVAFLITTIVAFVVGLSGLTYGYFVLSEEPRDSFVRWFIPSNLADFRSFISVGSMHNFSYLGGLIGMVAGGVYVMWKQALMRKARSYKILSNNYGKE